MTESEWLDCQKPPKMLDFLLGSPPVTPTDRKMLLLASALCRRLWHLLGDERSRRAVEIAERFADGNASKMVLASAHDAAFAAGLRVGETKDEAEYQAAEAVQYLTAGTHVHGGPRFAASCIVLSTVQDDVQRDQTAILRDIFGNPFRHIVIDPACLAWNDNTVVKLAKAIYDEPMLPSGRLDAGRLAILADALEDAGSHDAEWLAHLRGPAPHVRGCHALDALLGMTS